MFTLNSNLDMRFTVCENDLDTSSMKRYSYTGCRESLVEYISSLSKSDKKINVYILLKNAPVLDMGIIKAFLKCFNSDFNTEFEVSNVQVKTLGKEELNVVAIHWKHDGPKTFLRHAELSLLALFLENENIVNLYYTKPIGWINQLESSIMRIEDHEKYVWTSFYVYMKYTEGVYRFVSVSGPGETIYRAYNPEDAINFARRFDDDLRRKIRKVFERCARSSMKARLVLENI